MGSSEVDVAIIGSGPYGLSLATYLRRHGVQHRIFGVPMETWRKMPAGLNLKSSLVSPRNNPESAPVTRPFRNTAARAGSKTTN